MMANRSAAAFFFRAVIPVALALALFEGSARALTPPQPTLPKITLAIRDVKIEAEVADTPEEKMTGLMGRKELADGQGMLFVFPEPQPLGFWMKDTLLPLSVAYINAEGIIREIHDLQPLDENSVQSVVQNLLYALEVPQGWFAKNGILAGDKITGLPSPNHSK